MANPSIYGIPYCYNESVSAVTNTNTVMLGSRRFENGADWLYVYNGTADQAIDKGRGCALASLSSGYTVECSAPVATTATMHVFVGVAANATIGTAAYGWVMTRGQASVLNKTSAALAGEQLFYNVSGTFRTHTDITTLSGPMFRNKAIGMWLADASDTSATEAVAAYIKSPLF